LKNIWIDIINPSHALFFNSFLKELNEHSVNITIRDRAETVDLCKSFGIEGKVIGTDYFEKNKKALYMIYRTLKLAGSVPKFDISISFENGMGVFASKLRMKQSILFCDNDLKFSQNKSSAQDMETKIKSLADHIIIPEVCHENFSTSFNESKLITYNGCKEDIYIADYIPDPDFMTQIPFDDFVVIRPEALASFYVKENKSIVNDLITRFNKENINVIYLPREKEDIKYAQGCDYYTPEKPLNGLDLCYYADAILTGSGTLAREAACMGTKSVSFFPSKKLLSVDQLFVDQGKVIHSRDVDEIVDHAISQQTSPKGEDLDRCQLVKKEVADSVREILGQV
jgi:predicted glycosyltransferase